MLDKTRETSPQYVLVIGASKGIGQAVAAHFEAHGRPCIRAARSFASRPLVADGTSYTAHLDVTDDAMVGAFVHQLRARQVPLDTVIYAAGVGHFGPLDKITAEQWDETMAVNLRGAFTTLQAVYRLFKSRGTHGRIVTIGSVADHLALVGNAAYAASKFGLRGLMLTMHEEGRQFGISTTNVSLGATSTDIWRTRARFSAADMLSPQEVAESIYKLVTLPSKVTIPTVVITPPKGVL